MSNDLTPKQERFALNLFKGMSQRDAYVKAGYSAKSSPDTLDRHACALAKNDKIMVRLSDLQAKAETDAVMTKQERMARLSEIGRARVPDFVETDDKGIARIKVGPESLNSGAIQEIITETVVVADSPIKTQISKLKFHDPVRAIQELNKWDGAYAPDRHEITGKDGGPIEASVDAKSKLISLLDRIASQGGEAEGDTKSEAPGS
jgi:phage terminase small subunit